MLQLKSTIRSAPLLAAALTSSNERPPENELLQMVVANLRAPELTQMEARIGAVIDENAAFAKKVREGDGGATRTARTRPGLAAPVPDYGVMRGATSTRTRARASPSVRELAREKGRVRELRAPLCVRRAPQATQRMLECLFAIRPKVYALAPPLDTNPCPLALALMVSLSCSTWRATLRPGQRCARSST